MSFLYKTINERLVITGGRVPMAYVTHTEGRDAHLCLLVFYLHFLIIQNYKRKIGSYSGTRCYPNILKLSYLPYPPCRTLISLSAVFQFKSHKSLFCFNHDSLLLGAP